MIIDVAHTDRIEGARVSAVRLAKALRALLKSFGNLDTDAPLLRNTGAEFTAALGLGIFQKTLTRGAEDLRAANLYDSPCCRRGNLTGDSNHVQEARIFLPHSDDSERG